MKKLETHFGASFTQGKIYIYDNAKELQFFESFHIKVRNLDKEKRTEIYQLKRRNEPFKHLFES